MLIVNYKNYKSGYSESGTALSKMISEANSEVYFAPPQVELSKYSNANNPALTRLTIAQSLDCAEGSKSTGFVTPEILTNLGINMALVNHAEHELTIEKIENTVKLCKKYSVKVFLCFKTLDQLELIKLFNPDYYVYEPEALIGTTNSVVKLQSDVIQKLRETLKDKKFLIGAGINDESDIEGAYKMNVDGLLLSSIVMESADPTSSLLNLINWEKNMLYIASDHAGFKLKQGLIEIFKTYSIEFKDLGAFEENPEDDYPDFAYELSKSVVKESGKGILICRSGIGMSIAANKVKGIYAALCDSREHAIKSREHNNSNVLVLDDSGKEAIAVYDELVKPWLETKFDESEERHVRRIEKIKAIEEMTMK